MKKYFLIGFFLAGFSSFAFGQKGKKGSPDGPKSMEGLIARFCLANNDPYQLIRKWIKDNKGKNSVVIPLAMDPSCHDCHDPDQYKKDTAAIHKWMEASNKPESDMIRHLLTMQKDWELLGGSNIVNPDVPKCFYDFSDEEFSEMEKALAGRIYDRVIAMAKKNKGYPQYAFAGIMYLLSVTRDFMLIGGTTNDEEAMGLAADWLQSCYKQFDKRLFKEYQYQLYPSYIGMIRDLALAGVETNVDDMVKWLKKMEDFMHFKLKIEFEASGHGDNGGKYHALVSGETEIQCKLKEGCYVWEPVDGKDMEFEVKEVIFQSDQGSANYKLPKTFSAPVTLKVNMCADDPVFKITFDSFGDPRETYTTSEGPEFQSPLLYGLAMATLGSVNLDKMKSQLNDMKQKADQFKGKEGQMDAAAKRLNDHKNDPDYLKSPQGKADMASMNEAAKSMGYDPKNFRPDPKRMQNLDNLKAMNAKQQEINKKFSDPGYIASGAYAKDQAEIAALRAKVNMNDLSDAAGFTVNLLQIEAPFTIGVPKPVDKVQKDKIREIAGSANGWEFGQFHITIEKK
jgi:hypothetical protein